MLLSLSRLKYSLTTTKTYLVLHRRLLFILLFLLPLCSYLLSWLVLSTTSAFLPHPLKTAKEVLIVVAHPDDECTPPQSCTTTFQYMFLGVLTVALFFSPSILRTLRSGSAQGNMLVLSAGETRKTELIGACNTLGITRKDRCVVLDHKYPILVRDSANGRDLQDNPHVWWDTDLVAKIVQEYVKKWNVDSIITFDEGGVSGHINHRAVGAGVRHLALETPKLAAYQLTTIFVLRKYTILLDLPWTLFLCIPRLIKTMIWGDGVGSWGLMVASPGMYFTGRHAFERHASQVVWDRWLYMILSRYMYVNELRRVLP